MWTKSLKIQQPDMPRWVEPDFYQYTMYLSLIEKLHQPYYWSDKMYLIKTTKYERKFMKCVVKKQ